MKMAKRNTMMAMLAAVWLAGPFVSARAAEVTTAPQQGTWSATTTADEDKWTFTSPLYIWAIALTGTATVNGNNLNVDQSFTDLMDHMDQGFTAYLQFSKPQYGFYLNPNYYALTFSGHIGPAKAQLETKLWILEMAAYYRIWEMTGERPANLYVVGGARYWNLHNNFRIEGGPKDAMSQWLLDPMIGLRFNERITERVHVMAQSDMGGFNLAGQTSRFSWQLMALLGYDFTMPVIKKPSTVFGGWRQINVQKTSGSRTDNQDAINLNFSGIMIGLNVDLF